MEKKKPSVTLSRDARLLTGRAVHNITSPVYKLALRNACWLAVLLVFHLLKSKTLCVGTLLIVVFVPPTVFASKGEGYA